MVAIPPSILAYVPLINEYLDKFVIRKPEDLTFVADILRNLTFPKETIDLDENRISYLKELEEHFLSLKEIIDNPEMYVEDPKQHTDFKNLIHKRIAKKIDELIDLSKNPEEGKRYIADLNKKREEGRNCKQQMSTKKAPEKTNRAHVISEEDFEEWLKYESLWINKNLWNPQNPDHGVQLQDSFNAEFCQQIHSIEAQNQRRLTEREIKELLISLQSFLENTILIDSPLREFITAEEFYYLDVKKLIVFCSEELTARIVYLLEDGRVKFSDFKDLEEGNFRLLLDNYKEVIRFLNSGARVEDLFQTSFKRLHMIMKNLTMQSIIDEDLSFQNLFQLSDKLLYYLSDHLEYIKQFKNILGKGLTSATLSNLSTKQFKKSLKITEKKHLKFLQFLQTYQRGLQLQNSSNVIEIENFIYELGLKDYITSRQFVTLDARKMKKLIQLESKTILLKLNNKHKIQFDQILQLSKQQFKALLKNGYKLFELEITMEQFAQFNVNDCVAMIKDIENVKKILRWGIDFETLLRVDKLKDIIKVLHLPELAHFWRGVLLQKTHDDKLIQEYIRQMGLKDHVTVAQFLTYEKSIIKTLSQLQSERLDACKKHNIPFEKAVLLNEIQFEYLIKYYTKLLKLGMTIEEYAQQDFDKCSIMIKYMERLEKFIDWQIDIHTLLQQDEKTLKSALKALKDPRHLAKNIYQAFKTQPKLIFWVGVLLQKSKDETLFQDYLDYIGLKDFASPIQFQALNIGQLSVITNRKLLQTLLDICTEHKIEFDQIALLQKKQMEELICEGHKLLDLGITIEEFSQLSDLQRSIMIEYPESLKKILERVNFQILLKQDIGMLKTMLKSIKSPTHIHEHIIQSIKKPEKNLNFWQGVLLLKSQDEDLIRIYIRSLGLEDLITVHEFLTLDINEINELTHENFFQKDNNFQNSFQEDNNPRNR